MKLYVGYQLRQSDDFVNHILAHQDQIAEVYFSWDSMPSGRSIVGLQKNMLPWEASQRQRQDLRRIADAGIGLNLLLNANCYGSRSLERSFFQSVGDLIDCLRSEWNLVSVTTTSPVIGRFVRQNFEGLDVRASVNMEIGTPEGIDYLADCFDSFYARRELNRDINGLKKLRAHTNQIGKRLHMLANSGCLNYCSARQFHDNLVAHEQEIARMDNAFAFKSACRNFLSDPARRRQILQLSNWVRPEDLARYEGLVDGAKIATRTTPAPVTVLEAYASRSYSGNILDLTEPNLSDLFYPVVLNNRAFPSDFFEKRCFCGHACEKCGYCQTIYDRVSEAVADIYMTGNDLKEETESC